MGDFIVDYCELDELNDYILLHGYNKNIKKLKIDDRLINIVGNLLEYYNIEKEYIEIPHITKREMINNVKKFMNYYFELHKIGYLSDKKISMIFNNKKIYNIDDLIDLTKKNVKMINPFKLPINFVNEKIFEGSLDIQVVLLENELKKELLSKSNLYFTSINLPKIITSITEVAYVHELTHSQVESHKGITRDYYNSEVLSIFIELLYSLKDNNLYYLFIMQRLRNIIINFNNMYTFDIENKDIEVNGIKFSELDYYVCSKYLISILKAFKLLSIYLKDKKYINNYIIYQINEVFNGNISVETFLENIGVTYDNSLDSNIIRNLNIKL